MPESIVNQALDEIRSLYGSDDRPWVIGFSGGKDSTAALQLIWNAIAALPEDQRTKPIYVISGDTLVETPLIIDYLAGTLKTMSQEARRQGLPIKVHQVSPETEQTFWTNVIGRGYPAPSPRFRWCTERMKINPANRFILTQVAEYGEVIMVLGVRRSESATRAQVMSLQEIEGSLLSRHSRLPNAFVYTPVRDWHVDDIWSFLLQNESPWGSDNQQLLAMYRQSSSDECPLVVDTTTPSCGSSRFGCWTCTVVSRDKAMEAMIDKGEDWLEPLLDVRDFLAATQDPKVKAKVRLHVRKSGQVTEKNKGDMSDRVVRGPYKLDFCKEILAKLLEAEVVAQRLAPQGQAVSLIKDDELHAIRRIWRFERGDWTDSIPTLVAAHSERGIAWPKDDSAGFREDDEARLAKLCSERELPLEMVKALIDLERRSPARGRRDTTNRRLHQLLGREWRSEDEVLAEIEASGA